MAESLTLTRDVVEKHIENGDFVVITQNKEVNV